jgi:hypothetical protein
LLFYWNFSGANLKASDIYIYYMHRYSERLIRGHQITKLNIREFNYMSLTERTQSTINDTLEGPFDLISLQGDEFVLMENIFHGLDFRLV